MQNTEVHYKKMTETPVVKLVVQLGIPTTISMLITSIYNMADTYFVGTLGETPQGAIGVLFTLQAIIQAVAFMLGHGSGVYVSKELANKNVDKASKYVSTAFFVGAAFGVLFAIVGLLCLEPLMKLLGSTDTILPYAKQYGMWVLISCPFLVCSLVLNNNLRYEGKATFAMIGLCSGGVLNIGLDYVFVNLCHLGVFGAGMATAISQIISFVILLVMYVKKAQSKIAFRHFAKQGHVYLDVFKAGLPSLFRQSLASVSGGVLNHLAGNYGAMAGGADATISAMSIVNRLSHFVMCVGLGVGQGLQPVASFNYQAKQYTRVKRALLATCAIGFGAVTLLTVPLAIWPQFFVSVFQKEQAVVQIGAKALRYAAVGLLFVPLFTPVNMLFQSIRKAGIASFLSLLRNGLTFIPTIFLATHLLGVTGVLIAQPIADVLTGLINVPFLIWFVVKTPNTAPEEKQDNSPADTLTATNAQQKDERTTTPPNEQTAENTTKQTPAEK